jgi:hypothetical protein
MAITGQMKREDRELDFYRQQSEISSPGKYESLFRDLPINIGGLCGVVQNLLVHGFWILDEQNYGITAESLKRRGRIPNKEINLRSVEEKLGLLVELEDQSLTKARDVGRRVVGNCGDYAVLLVSMLRHQGIPARVRSGAARYFYPEEEGVLEDHFICEYWNEEEARWQRVDAQIDEVQRRALRLTIDATDLLPSQFLDAGESFYELKSGNVKPEKIGIFDFRGWPYTYYKLVSDLACVNRKEVLAWEGWGICERIGSDRLSEADVALLEEIAKLLAALATHPDRFREATELFKEHPDLLMPRDYGPRYHEFPFLT